MSRAKRVLKQKVQGRPSRLMGVAGALSLSGACSASASTSSAGNMQSDTRVLLGEEEVSDVSLSTF